MLDKTATYHKSARGAEAIATRDRGLSPRQRSMLILINGRRDFDELARLAQVLGDPGLLMEQLLQQGHIEAGEPRAGPPTAPAPLLPSFEASGWGASVPALLEPTPLHVPLEQAQRFAVEKLTDLLGPAGDDLCARLQAARDANEFQAAVLRTETILRAVVGPELAAQFTKEVQRLGAL